MTSFGNFVHFYCLPSPPSSQHANTHYIHHLMERAGGITDLHIFLPSHLFFGLENIKAQSSKVQKHPWYLGVLV